MNVSKFCNISYNRPLLKELLTLLYRCVSYLSDEIFTSKKEKNSHRKNNFLYDILNFQSD